MTQVIGIIGGIGSGKSAVAAAFVTEGAICFDADQVGHDVLNTSEIQEAARTRWGNTVFLSEKNAIDRQQLAMIVFAETPESRKELDYLNALIHPRIKACFDKVLQECRQKGIRYLVLDAPLLLESGWQSVCDVILFVEADEEIRLQRIQNRNWDKDELHRREKKQVSLQKKRERANYIIDNNSSYEKMYLEVKKTINFLESETSIMCCFDADTEV